MPVVALLPHPSTPRPRRATARAGAAAVVTGLAVGLLGSGCAWVDDGALEVGTGAVEETSPSPGQQSPTVHPTPPAPATTAAPASSTPDAATVEKARTALASLPRVDRRPTGLPPYERKAFGSAWSDVDGNGCNQRDDVLLRDARPGTVVVQQQGRCEHDAVAGTWSDPYSGRVLVLDDLKDQRQAQTVQIDHVVPLSEAWRSGAWAWSAERRRQFANDLDVLLAVHGPTNASKGDDDPAAWRPRRAYQCAYAVRWTLTKDTWELGVDRSERAALGEMLDSCPAA